jgi:ABC-type Fe3+-hydroxamate transport system substrate-binding protein
VPILRLRDDLGRDVIIARPPERVVSLVPSDTYSLFALGCGARVVGRTRYCELPPEAAAIPAVGGTKDVDVDAVLALSPDLVIANQEENTRPALERLAAQVKVLVSLPRRAADGVAHLARLARALGVEREPAAVDLVRRGYAAVRDAQARASAPAAAPLPVFVPIWMDPLMTFNADTFGADMLALAGARNVFDDRLRLYPLAADLGKTAAADAGGRDVRYPRIRPDEVAARAPAAILLPDEPHPFTAADGVALSAAAGGAPTAHVSGKDLFWYGAWTVDALPRLAAQLAALAARVT